MNGGSPLSRRRLLKLGIASGVAVGLGGSALAWFKAGYGRFLDAQDRPIALTTKELAVVKALVRALLPEDGPLPSGESLRIAQRVDEEVWAASDPARSEVGWGLQLLEHGPRLYGLRGRLTELSPDDARLYFGRVLDGKHDALRQIGLAMRQLLHLSYYANPATWSAIGYDGPFVKDPVPPETRKRYLSIMNGQA